MFMPHPEWGAAYYGHKMDSVGTQSERVDNMICNTC